MIIAENKQTFNNSVCFINTKCANNAPFKANIKTAIKANSKDTNKDIKIDLAWLLKCEANHTFILFISFLIPFCAVGNRSG